jgi:hypothetical protein
MYGRRGAGRKSPRSPPLKPAHTRRRGFTGSSSKIRTTGLYLKGSVGPEIVAALAVIGVEAPRPVSHAPWEVNNRFFQVSASAPLSAF